MILKHREYKSGTGWCVWQWSFVENLTRLHIIKTPYFAVCLHWIHNLDLVAYEHDHPVSFLSIILRGFYYETRFGKDRPVIWFNWMRATDRHRIVAVMKSGRHRRCPLTLVFMGPKVREWGFFTERGWVMWKDYYAWKELYEK